MSVSHFTHFYILTKITVEIRSRFVYNVPIRVRKPTEAERSIFNYVYC